MRSFSTKKERKKERKKEKKSYVKKKTVTSGQAYMLHWKFGTKQETHVVNIRPKRFEHGSTTNQSFVIDDLQFMFIIFIYFLFLYMVLFTPT